MRSGNHLFLATVGALALGCSGDFHSDRGLNDMTCDESGCFFCGDGFCEEYRCDETHQCPMQTQCSADHHCLPDGSSGGCTSNDDCRQGEICTLAGACVTSPGGGPGKDATDANDTAGETTGDTSADTGPGDVDLPDHPDNVCHANGDCGTDGTCINGGCYFPCTHDDKCPPQQACVAGQCRAAEVENQCTFNGECGTNNACVEGTCYDRCEETLNCQAHTRCASGICIADTSPAIQCSGPNSCDAGKACVDGKCLSACVDGACETGFVCEVGYCSRQTSCFDANDCGGKDCVDGACVQ